MKHDLDKLGDLKFAQTEESELQAWDEAYYRNKFLESKPHALPNHYFTIDACLAGALEIAYRLFDIRFEKDADLSDVWHPSVLKYNVTSNGQCLGVVYLDLYERANKDVGAAVYPIRLRSTGVLPRFALSTSFSTE